MATITGMALICQSLALAKRHVLSQGAAYGAAARWRKAQCARNLSEFDP
jgi:hypothetical protein